MVVNYLPLVIWKGNITFSKKNTTVTYNINNTIAYGQIDLI